MTAPHYHDHIDSPEAVGQRIWQARSNAGISQRQLAFPGCSAAYISRLEAGERVPSMQLAKKLAEKLSVSLGFILRGEESVDLNVNVNDVNQSIIDATLNEISWADLTASERSRILEAMSGAALTGIPRVIEEIAIARERAEALRRQARELIEEADAIASPA